MILCNKWPYYGPNRFVNFSPLVLYWKWVDGALTIYFDISFFYGHVICRKYYFVIYRQTIGYWETQATPSFVVIPLRCSTSLPPSPPISTSGLQLWDQVRFSYLWFSLTRGLIWRCCPSFRFSFGHIDFYFYFGPSVCLILINVICLLKNYSSWFYITFRSQIMRN